MSLFIVYIVGCDKDNKNVTEVNVKSLISGKWKLVQCKQATNLGKTPQVRFITSSAIH
jgi:hypothetical protein